MVVFVLRLLYANLRGEGEVDEETNDWITLVVW